MSRPSRAVVVRNTSPDDFPAIIDLCRVVYPDSPPWTEAQLESHLRLFPEGQFVACSAGTGRLLGMAASLIVQWDDYTTMASWRDFTDHGMFTNHDPENGRTLYAAEIMVVPTSRGQGVGTKIYRARRDLTKTLGLLRIRAGARLRGYHRYADQLSAEDYAIRVVRKEISDPTLSFQLRRGFRVLAVIPGYLRNDRESLGYAALIEWLNPDLARPEDSAGRDTRFIP